LPTVDTRIARGLRLLAECGLFDDILQPNYSRVQGFTKRGKNTAATDSRAHIALQDSIMARPSKKTAHNKTQLEKSWLSVCASGGTASIWQRGIRKGFKHQDLGNEDPDQGIDTQTVAACIS
jgi:hypothetical protein